jgi:hypothetical protein
MAGEANSNGGGGPGFVLALGLVVIIGLGSGFGFGYAFRSPPGGNPSAESESKPKPAKHHAEAGPAPEAEDAAKKPVSDVQLQVFPLDPVLVNLSGKERSWIRLEGSVVFAATPDKDKAVLIAEMAEDIAGYLRGTSVSQLESAAGLEFLREDLSELVQLRSRNRAVRFILRSLAVE